MTATVIQGAFLGGQPRLSIQPGIAPPPLRAPPPIPAKGAGRPPGPPALAFAGRPGAVQRQGAGGAFAVAAAALGLASGGGRALPDSLRGKMEAALGADFSTVRVHVGPQAERIGAIAFTLGSDIYFAPGRYQPETVAGQQLLGHELAHVVQQRAGRVRNPLGAGLAVVQDRTLEAEADRLGQRAAMHRVAAQAKSTMPPPAVAKLRPAHSSPRTDPPVLARDCRSFRAANSRAAVAPLEGPRAAAKLGPAQTTSMRPVASARSLGPRDGFVQRVRIPFRSHNRAAASIAGKGVIQRLILYMQNDQMHQKDAAALAHRSFWWDEANFYWGNVQDLTFNADSTLTLLGHADQSTFGTLTAKILVGKLIKRNIGTSTHRILELVGCGASMTESQVNPTFVDQVQELLNERLNKKKTIVVKGLKQPASGTYTTLARFDNGKFVYMSHRQKHKVEDAVEYLKKRKQMYGDNESAYVDFISYLKTETEIDYQTDYFANIRNYLDVPTEKPTHKKGRAKSELTKRLLQYEN